MNIFTPKRLESSSRFLWALVLLAFPITSFPYIPFLGTETQVRPLSLYPAALLLAVLAFRSLLEKRLHLWSKSLLPLLGFALVALISSSMGVFLAPLDQYQSAYDGRVLRAWITFATGVVFALIAIVMNRDNDDLKFTLKWLYIGFSIQIAWSFVQLLGFYTPNYPFRMAIVNFINFVQPLFVITGLAPYQRISGLTLEPSWLAAEIITAYLPWAFASLLKGYHWTRRIWVSVVVFIAGIILLIFTYSRGGILIAAVALLLTFLVAGWGWIRAAWHWFLHPIRSVNSVLVRNVLGIGLRILITFAILGSVVGGAYLLSQNAYFAKIWNSQKTDLIAYFIDISAGPRLAVAWAGWTIFEQHPWTGVGLGAAGLYIRNALPAWSHINISEISVILAPGNTTYPNTKNLYTRLLAETGIIGFWLFIAFYMLLMGKILTLLRSIRKEDVFIGVAGLFTLLGIIALGLSQDSLAMPTIWIPLGILIGLADSRT
jgi:O-antigen ligase